MLTVTRNPGGWHANSGRCRWAGRSVDWDAAPQRKLGGHPLRRGAAGRGGIPGGALRVFGCCDALVNQLEAIRLPK
jgi:hypothetical protein